MIEPYYVENGIEIYNADCLDILPQIEGKSVDLFMTDPPYLIGNTKAGGHSKLAKSIQPMNDELSKGDLVGGFDKQVLNEIMRTMKKLNLYIWCNGKQIPMYLDFFSRAKFDIIIWNKTNATPLFHNKYLTDKEYCFYFRKGGYCQPANYTEAKTVYYQPINIKDKRKWDHPTIKPLNIIQTLVKNSSKEGQLIIDPFMGSGSTLVAAKILVRRAIGIEINKEYCDIAIKRLKGV